MRGQQGTTPNRGLMWYLHNVIMVAGLYCDLETFADTSKVISSFSDSNINQKLYWKI